MAGLHRLPQRAKKKYRYAAEFAACYGFLPAGTSGPEAELGLWQNRIRAEYRKALPFLDALEDANGTHRKVWFEARCSSDEEAGAEYDTHLAHKQLDRTQR